MKKDIESLIAQEKAEIVAKYEKVPPRAPPRRADWGWSCLIN